MLIESGREIGRIGLPDRGFLSEWGPTLRLAWPVIVSEIGWMIMGLVDTAMVGHLGPSAIGAVSLGSMLHFFATLLGLGLLYGLDPIISQAVGAGKFDEARRGLIQGIYLALIVSPLTIVAQYATIPLLTPIGIDSTVAAAAGPYMQALAWGSPPLFVFFALKRYLQGVGLVRPLVFALVFANLVNWFGNRCLINGEFGFPRLGVEGSGWSTTGARFALAGFLAAVCFLRDEETRRAWRATSAAWDFPILRRLVVLGLPAAGHLTLEVGVFALATTLVGRIDPISLAAHQIALNVASLTFMVPLGVSAAGAVRVGHAVGRKDWLGAKHSGSAALYLGGGFMFLAGMIIVLSPRSIALLFSDDAGLILKTTALLYVAAAFQFFDGIQVVATGILRGAGETRAPMIWGFAAYWLVGLPIGAWAGLYRGWGVLGLWLGLSAGLILVGIALFWAWLGKLGQLRTELSVQEE